MGKVKLRASDLVAGINQSRDFGCSTDLLKKVHSYFFIRSYEDNVPLKNLKYSKESLEKQIRSGAGSKEDEIRLQEIDRILKDKELVTVFRTDISYFSNLIFECLTNGTETGIKVYSDGVVVEYSNKKDYSNEVSNLNRTAPYIYVSLYHYLINFIKDEQLSKFISPLQLLNDDEIRVLKALRNDNIKEINIQLKNGGVDRIDTTKTGIVTNEEAKRIMDALGLRNYEKITLETRDEKTLSFKKTFKNLK